MTGATVRITTSSARTVAEEALAAYPADAVRERAVNLLTDIYEGCAEAQGGAWEADTDLIAHTAPLYYREVQEQADRELAREVARVAKRAADKIFRRRQDTRWAAEGRKRCGRCDGTGVYGHHGTCWRCDGKGAL